VRARETGDPAKAIEKTTDTHRRKTQAESSRNAPRESIFSREVRQKEEALGAGMAEKRAASRGNWLKYCKAPAAKGGRNARQISRQTSLGTGGCSIEKFPLQKVTNILEGFK